MVQDTQKDIHFLVSNEEAEELKTRAWEARMSRADYIRSKLALGKTPPKQKEGKKAK